MQGLLSSCTPPEQPVRTSGCLRVPRCRQLMDIWPSFKWLKVLSQPWEGDVTMVLPSSFMQIAKAITNPSLDDLKGACLLVGAPAAA